MQKNNYSLARRFAFQFAGTEILAWQRINRVKKVRLLSILQSKQPPGVANIRYQIIYWSKSPKNLAILYAIAFFEFFISQRDFIGFGPFTAPRSGRGVAFRFSIWYHHAVGDGKYFFPPIVAYCVASRKSRVYDDLQIVGAKLIQEPHRCTRWLHN